MSYQIDFAPKGSRAARGIRPVRPIWMDVRGGRLYPVFNVRKGSGRNGRFTYPDDAQNPYGGGPRRNEWVVDRPACSSATGGHLHPGGLHTDLKLRRQGRTGPAVPLEGEVLRARGRRVVGRRHDRQRQELEA